ncbi:MAG: 50S ribosome-binding GTPase [Nanoarchaeota archaeon]|nr:50S ribosome-binding GTPase [Nanoarchaeota archaeon]MBU1027451.1 50S ribosome-binding GTPase [Nanoarchaeota archaeon]
MRKRYSFSSRHTKRARDSKNLRKQKKKFPDVVQKVLDLSDIILQVLDARFIEETRNLEIEKEIERKNKKIIYIINKSDLADKIITQISPRSIISCTKRTGIKTLRNRVKAIASKINKEEKIIVGVIGYPNTGKSSLINLLIGKKSAKTGAEAGYTKGLQKLKLSSNVILLDSPGVIPKQEYSNIGNKKIAKHVKVGARTYSQVKDPEQIIAELIKEFSDVLQKHYNIQTKSPEYLLEKLGRQKNFLKKGKEVNFDKTARQIIKDWQNGKIKV